MEMTQQTPADFCRKFIEVSLCVVKLSGRRNMQIWEARHCSTILAKLQCCTSVTGSFGGRARLGSLMLCYLFAWTPDTSPAGGAEKGLLNSSLQGLHLGRNLLYW